jgi:hypothetical protein
LLRKIELFAILAGLSALTAAAQNQSSVAYLHIDGNVMPAISLIFQNNPSVGTTGFCPVSNSGSNMVGLDLGTASSTVPDSLACVQYSSFFGYYLVSSGFDVVVSKTNSSSANYQLAAQISAAPPSGVTWLLNGTTLTTAFTTIQTANNYAQPITQTLRVLVNNSTPAQSLFETINFVATAN